MRMIEIDYDAQPPIDGYAPGGFRVAGQWHAGGLIIMADGPRPLPGAPGLETLAAVLDAADDLDLVVIGQGADIAPIPRDLRQALEAAEIGIEIMSTPSACRTYNVLLTEDRRVAAVLVPV
jgi:uncharacterized protein